MLLIVLMLLLLMHVINNHYDDDEQQYFPRDTTLSPFQDSLAAALHHDDRVVGSPRSVCTTA